MTVGKIYNVTEKDIEELLSWFKGDYYSEGLIENWIKSLPYNVKIPYTDNIIKSDCSCGNDTKAVGENYCRRCLDGNPLLCT